MTDMATDWHVEYQQLLKRVQHLNGVVGVLGGLALHWQEQPGSITCAEAGATILECLDGGQQPARRQGAVMTSTTAAHSCDNCEGIDPATCLANPNRPRDTTDADLADMKQRAEQAEAERDRLAAELAELRAQARRITSHTYEGPGACRTDFYGQTCGGDKTDHQLIDEEA